MTNNYFKNFYSFIECTDNGHPERAFFQKFESFGLGQTNWAEILGCILVISSQTIGTILALWVPCSWESVAGSFSYKKCWFLSLKHITHKCSQNKILAVKNLEKSLRTSVFGGYKTSACVRDFWSQMYLSIHYGRNFYNSNCCKDWSSLNCWNYSNQLDCANHMS